MVTRRVKSIHPPLLMLHLTHLLKPALTGDQRELLPPLRIKDSAVHAGPSHPLVPLKELGKSRIRNYGAYQNNSLLIVILKKIPLLEKPTKVAMVEIWPLLLTMLLKTELQQDQSTHTLLMIKIAYMIRLI
jgi:hypothetical protein